MSADGTTSPREDSHMTTQPNQPLTDEELAEIRGSYRGVDEFDDVPRLLAEVDRLRAENTALAAKLDELPDLDTIRRIEKERGTWGMQLSEARREIAELRAAALGLDQNEEGQVNG